ncbi:MAG: glycosyltransferase family 39 protein [Planctomycetes bacterium]|nr:glycosyltransferase family 39 protein [Planctomycetota bacterium]
MQAPHESQRSGATWIALALLVGLALRVFEAWESSLWLDELHTLFHASRPSVDDVLQSVRNDFHVPGFYVFCHFFGDFSTGAWLRWIPIVFTLLVAWPLVALARESRGGERCAIAVAWFYALMPYQVHYGAELRPYAWLELATAAAAWAAFSERGSKKLRGAVFFASVVLGMFTHVIMALAVLAIGAARLFVRGRERLGLPVLIGIGAAAVAPVLPWFLWFHSFATQKREEFVAAAGEHGVRPQLLREVRDLPIRLVEPYMGSLKGPWATLAVVGFGAFVLVVLALVWSAWRARRERLASGESSTDPLFVAVVIFALVQFAAITVLSIKSWDRVPLQYYIGMSWALPFVLAAWLASVRAERVRRALGVALVTTMLAMSVALAGGESREPYREAVAKAREWGTSLAAAFPEHPPVYTSVLAQPSGVFDHKLPYLAYGADLGAVEPEDVPSATHGDFQRPVIVIRRALALEHPKWAPITTGRKLVREERLHDRVWVYVFAPSNP